MTTTTATWTDADQAAATAGARAYFDRSHIERTTVTITVPDVTTGEPTIVTLTRADFGAISSALANYAGDMASEGCHALAQQAQETFDLLFGAFKATTYPA
jgi:hypothetical protein